MPLKLIDPRNHSSTKSIGSVTQSMLSSSQWSGDQFIDVLHMHGESEVTRAAAGPESLHARMSSAAGCCCGAGIDLVVQPMRSECISKHSRSLTPGVFGKGDIIGSRVVICGVCLGGCQVATEVHGAQTEIAS